MYYFVLSFFKKPETNDIDPYFSDEEIKAQRGRRDTGDEGSAREPKTEIVFKHLSSA